MQYNINSPTQEEQEENKKIFSWWYGNSISGRRFHTANMIDSRRMLIYGGMHSPDDADGHNVYDIESDEWCKLPIDDSNPAPGIWSQGSVMISKNCLLVFGGFTTTQLNSVLLLRIENNKGKWENLTHLCQGDIPTPRSYPACAAVDHYLVVFGGFTDEEELYYQDTLIFNFHTLHWKNVTPFHPSHTRPPPSTGSSLTLVGDTLYLFGGGGCHTNGNNFFKAEANHLIGGTQSWQRVTPRSKLTPGFRSEHAAAAVGRYLFIAGGKPEPDDGFCYRNNIWMFDTDPETWSIVELEEDPRPPIWVQEIRSERLSKQTVDGDENDEIETDEDGIIIESEPIVENCLSNAGISMVAAQDRLFIFRDFSNSLLVIETSLLQSHYQTDLMNLFDNAQISSSNLFT
eukprot:gb/GECH01001175.1/.p1 GENE.gb/GECH01001175.1/~~gb/GECH01001175.1/.p1  ORF type:complete len:401 (+),score=105.18 gb/GECH01001175.1/:1-1203(+)